MTATAPQPMSGSHLLAHSLLSCRAQRHLGHTPIGVGRRHPSAPLSGGRGAGPPALLPTHPLNPCADCQALGLSHWADESLEEWGWAGRSTPGAQQRAPGRLLEGVYTPRPNSLGPAPALTSCSPMALDSGVWGQKGRPASLCLSGQNRMSGEVRGERAASKPPGASREARSPG